MRPVVFPRPLNPGDRIAILSPASIVKPDYVNGAMEVLSSCGWKPYICPHTVGRCGSYSGCASDRLSDLESALLDRSTRAIMCSRGGYGVVHLLERLEQLPLADDPKWLIGFSDISALHALFASKGIASLHASMTKHLSTAGGRDADSAALFGILRGEMPQYSFPAHHLNRTGKVQGRIIGGNLAVLAGLIGTPFDIFGKDGGILFIEDIAEPIYKVERILYQLRLCGVLQSLKGLIVGQFTEYRPDANYHDMETMIHDMVSDYGFPVAFDVPIGHVDHNVPVVENAMTTLDVSSDAVVLDFRQPDDAMAQNSES